MSKNIVHLIDCMEFMKDVPDKYYELAIVDPPYGIGVDGINPIANKSGDMNHNFDHSKMWDEYIPDESYFSELRRVSQKQIIWGGNYFLDYLGFCKAPIFGTNLMVIVCMQMVKWRGLLKGFQEI
jgi:site-specific DNA-methyltransferase (adenine-specific)